MNRRLSGRIGINLLGLLAFAIMTFPVYWMVSTAFKEGRNIQTDTPSSSRRLASEKRGRYGWASQDAAANIAD